MEYKMKVNFIIEEIYGFSDVVILLKGFFLYFIKII